MVRRTLLFSLSEESDLEGDFSEICAWQVIRSSYRRVVMVPSNLLMLLTTPLPSSASRCLRSAHSDSTLLNLYFTSASSD